MAPSKGRYHKIERMIAVEPLLGMGSDGNFAPGLWKSWGLKAEPGRQGHGACRKSDLQQRLGSRRQR